MLPSTMLRFLSVLQSSNHGLRETLGLMECENLSVSATSQLFYHSSNILCFATGSKSRAIDCALYTILPKVACRASKSALSFPAIPTCASTHVKLTSRSLLVSCQHFCLHSYTNGWVCSEISFIELILSVKIKNLPSASFYIWSIVMRIAASSAVKTHAGPLIRDPILQSIE
jgi:hypothetical protein